MVWGLVFHQCLGCNNNASKRLMIIKSVKEVTKSTKEACERLFLCLPRNLKGFTLCKVPYANIFFVTAICPCSLSWNPSEIWKAHHVSESECYSTHFCKPQGCKQLQMLFSREFLGLLSINYLFFPRLQNWFNVTSFLVLLLHVFYPPVVQCVLDCQLHFDKGFKSF